MPVPLHHSAGIIPPPLFRAESEQHVARNASVARVAGADEEHPVDHHRAGHPGHLIYVRKGALLAQPFDARRLALTGEPVALAERVETTGLGTGGNFSVSRAVPLRTSLAAKTNLS